MSKTKQYIDVRNIQKKLLASPFSRPALKTDRKQTQERKTIAWI